MFQELPFYNTFIKKPRIKLLENIDLLDKLPFYDELSVKQISKAFKRYAESYKIEIIDSKDPLVQLEVGKSGLFRDLLDEIKNFEYQIIAKVFLEK